MIPKFRAWDKTHKKMGFIDAHMTDGIFQSVKIFDEDDDDWQESENFILMQSTGLFDENGKDIFEGDVVRQVRTQPTTENEIITGVVTMLEGAWLLINDREQLASYLWSETDTNKVVGNIYENPELLENMERD
ncbi:YopX family protein [Streptococcus anginosus]|uniref:YopX family protein n=1 Tax=Streptococcus anginosus TaxID=1328 RepID=UPI0021F8ACD1|nr:YopX family protein [Streptococcus anginosus]MCW0924628.1 YopX family protein [Streptococcus anginosus]